MFIQTAAARARNRVAPGFSLDGFRLRQFFHWSMKVCCAGLLAACTVAAANAQALMPGQAIGWGEAAPELLQIPVMSPPLDNISAISSDLQYTAALRNNGTIVVWGPNAALVTPPPDLNDVTAIAAGANYLMALRRNGTVTFLGTFPRSGPYAPGALTDVVAIAVSEKHAMALKKDGTVIDWRVSDGALIEVPAFVSDITAIAAGENHALALRKDGKVFAWGDNESFQTDVPPNLTGVVEIAATRLNSFALQGDGSVVPWGDTFPKVFNDASSLANVKAISVRGSHGLALLADGTVQAWGFNFAGVYDPPPALTNVKAVTVGTLSAFALNPAPLLVPLPPYTFSGFKPPVNGSPVINIGKAGRTYPVKWQLKNEAGAFVSRLDAVKSINSMPTQCGAFSSEPTDLLDTASAGDTALRYDATANQFIYNWKTPSSTGCHTLFLTLDSGQIFTAYFNLAK